MHQVKLTTFGDVASFVSIIGGLLSMPGNRQAGVLTRGNFAYAGRIARPLDCDGGISGRLAHISEQRRAFIEALKAIAAL
jgi:hypothetical protein